MSAKKIKPAYWVIEWFSEEEFTKNKSKIAQARAWGFHVRAVYAGWGAASAAPMVSC